ncbi:hypothetical protein GUJ93_ZPchr0007g5964 [Zizania palustris]|uniref:Uncharacterized protein n=1 Tax=Zizania palustris TaxID=103762 RepID=A0A8J5W4D7_ZIZPA|nr:hypothetical protein GUJ93_ZPchr0007g5964 [Zizania palustris]
MRTGHTAYGSHPPPQTSGTAHGSGSGSPALENHDVGGSVSAAAGALHRATTTPTPTPTRTSRAARSHMID